MNRANANATVECILGELSRLLMAVFDEVKRILNRQRTVTKMVDEKAL